MEENPFEAIENNVFGTLNVARAANECGAASFILISSDKAVRTDHEQVRIYVGNPRPQFDTDAWLQSLKEICLARDTARLVAALREMVTDYTPGAYLLE